VRPKATIAAAALLSAITTAHPREVRSGYWSVYDRIGDKQTPLCGMQTVYADVKASIIVKYILGSNHLTVHIFKRSGWRFPADHPISFPVTLGFDNETFGHVTADGIDDPKAGPMIEFYIATEAINNFLTAFGAASWMWIRFDEGTEKTWPAKMEGSRNAASMFARCISNLIDANSAQPYGRPETQPYGNSSTQPYGNSRTQPYSAAPPSQPNNGAPKAGRPLMLPSAKKDDGSI
jgi:hypothetical protein